MSQEHVKLVSASHRQEYFNALSQSVYTCTCTGNSLLQDLSILHLRTGYNVYGKYTKVSMCRVPEGDGKHSREVLDRRRLEMAHLQYALLQVCGWYPDKLPTSQVAITPGDLDATITTVGEVYYSLFAAKYASKHSENILNCAMYTCILGVWIKGLVSSLCALVA